MRFEANLRISRITRISLQRTSRTSLWNIIFVGFFFPFKVRYSVKHCQEEGYVLQFLVLKWSKKIAIYSNDQQTRKIVKDSIDCLLTLLFIYRIDYGLSNTDRLYEYISARMYGEHTGDCESAYPQCPFSAFNLIGK